MINLTKTVKGFTSLGVLIGFSIYTMTMSVSADGTLNEVDLTVNGETETIITSARNVEDVLENAKHKVKPSDKINYELSDDITEEMEIVVSTEKKVSLTTSGTNIEVKTNANTVAELLKENEVSIKKNDIVIPALDSKLTEESEITVIHHKEESYEKHFDVEFATEKEFSFEVPYGESVILQEGVNGVRTDFYKRVVKNEIVLSEEKTDSEITLEPITEKIAVGTKEVIEESIDYKVVTNENSSMFEGETKVVQKGDKGIKQSIYKNDGENRELTEETIVKEAVDEIVEKGVKKKPVEVAQPTVEAPQAPSTATSQKYSLSEFKFNGVVHEGGRKYTYYSQSVLPGGGLRIPGRHVNSGGYVADGSGYIVLASNRSIAKGTVIDTPFGYKGKVYDVCASCTPEWIDVYIK